MSIMFEKPVVTKNGEGGSRADGKHLLMERYLE